MRTQTIVLSLLVSAGMSPVLLRAAGGSGAAAAIAPLENCVRHLEDIDAVKRLQRAYGYYIDRGYWKEAADLFADDATFEWGQDGVYVGRERILAYLVRSGGGNAGPGLPYGQINHHIQLQPVVTVAPDGRFARARWRELALLGRFGIEAEWGQGIYENSYVKERGVWKIGSTHYFPVFAAPYEQGWATLQPAPADWRTPAARQFPADRAPSVAYQPFPAPFTVPFHYAGAEGELVRSPAIEPGASEEARRLAILRSRRAIENLQGMFGYYVERGLWTQAAGLFAREGTYEHGQGGVYVGPARIARALALTGPEGLRPGQLNIYMMVQPVIDVAADNRTAKARWRSNVMLADGGKGQWGEGVHENEYVNIDGQWRFKSYVYSPTFLADYEKGWSAGPIALSGPDAALPPDRPPTETYASFPSTRIVRFHYAHPVAGATGPAAWPASTDRERAMLRSRIERLEDHDAIEKLQRAYGYYVDKNLWGDVANLFAEHGSVEIGGRGVFVSRPHILDYLRSLGPEGPTHGLLMNHQQLQGIVTVDPQGSTAAGRWTALVMAGKVPDANWGDVTYENRYVKVDGIWRIDVLHAAFNMYTPYADGWARKASPITRPDSWPPPPDYPPTVLYNNYPSFHVEPYHYVNPVTGLPMPKPHPAAGGVAPMAPLSPAATP